jgi:hypothetical protein
MNDDLVDAFGLREEDFRGYVRNGDLTIDNVDRRCAEFVSAFEEACEASGDEPSPVTAEQLARYVRQLIIEEDGDPTAG